MDKLLSKAAGHPRFLELVLANLEADDVPDMTAWPFSHDEFVALRDHTRKIACDLEGELTKFVGRPVSGEVISEMSIAVDATRF